MTEQLRVIRGRYWTAVLFLCVTAAITDRAAAQTASLSLSGDSGAPGASVTLSVSLNSNGGTQPAALQWDFNYSTTDLSPASGTYYATGAAASAAGKSVTCNTVSAGDVRCLVAGINATAIGNGVVATVTFQIAAGTTATSSPVALVGASASDSSGHPVTITASGATVIINRPPPVLASLTCRPSSITAPATSTCTVALSGSVSSNTSVALSSSSGSVSVPASVTLASGASSATFTANAPAPVTTSGTAVLTASLNGVARTFTLTYVPAAALFVKTDTATQGTWKGVYGADGEAIANDSANYPTYAQVSFNGATPYTWTPSTTDVRALQKGAASDRIASVWYASTRFTIDVNLMDGNLHEVGLYCLDWDNTGRSETIDILDAVSGTVLDSRSVSAFSNGEWVLWNLSGHVTIR
ncbi:MAG TPA: cohesin domain-containing protein, partial [Alphaproteobacteria bacterium]|nr:cohesin domain-containing protein [Alphaproteobacteria bacterium]